MMENVLAGIDDSDVYIDDVGAFSTSWELHIEFLQMSLQHPRDNGLAVNPLKCEWAIKELDWIGYLLTPRGLKSRKKKIDAILHMACLWTSTDLCYFISCVHFIVTCGQATHMFWSPSLTVWAWKRDSPLNGLMTWTMHSPKWSNFWQLTCSLPSQIATNMLTITLICPTTQWVLVYYKKTSRRNS
jgi:hypothetical protein